MNYKITFSQKTMKLVSFKGLSLYFGFGPVKIQISTKILSEKKNQLKD